MAAGSFIFPDKAKLAMFEATAGTLANGSSNYRMALVSSAWTPNDATDEKWADMSASEIANGQGYATGGGTLSSVTLTQTGGTVKFTSAAYVWTATGTGIPVWRRGVVYYLGTINGVVNPIIGHFLGDSTPADIPLTTSGNTLTVTPNASGILSAV